MSILNPRVQPLKVQPAIQVLRYVALRAARASRNRGVRLSPICAIESSTCPATASVCAESSAGVRPFASERLFHS